MMVPMLLIMVDIPITFVFLNAAAIHLKQTGNVFSKSCNRNNFNESLTIAISQTITIIICFRCPGGQFFGTLSQQDDCTSYTGNHCFTTDQGNYSAAYVWTHNAAEYPSPNTYTTPECPTCPGEFKL